MKKFGFLALIGVLFLASFAQAQDTPTEDELQPDTVEDDLGAAREGELFDLKFIYSEKATKYAKSSPCF